MVKFIKIAALLVIGSFLLGGIALSQKKDEFDFLPDSGQELLIKILAKCPKCEPITTLAAAKRTQAEWKTYFTSKEALKGLTDKQVNELTAYMSVNFPTAKGKVPNVKNAASFPVGGRNLLLEKCMFCHLISLPVLSAPKNELGWMQLFTKADHKNVVEDMDEAKKKTLAKYLAMNFPIPKEKLPEELLEPAPGY
jgi:hypothetical protein